MTPFRAVGLELWSMTSDIYFDNFIISADKEVADRWAADSWGLKKLVASANEVRVYKLTNSLPCKFLFAIVSLHLCLVFLCLFK